MVLDLDLEERRAGPVALMIPKRRRRREVLVLILTSGLEARRAGPVLPIPRKRRVDLGLVLEVM